MKAMTEDNITAAALDRLSAAAHPRTREIVTGVIRHLHDCARELRLTPDEWKIGIDFLAAAGHLTDDKRNEFILLSDTLGLSALVDLMRHSGEHATASSLLGPFYREGAPEFELGASIAGETPGEPLIVRGLIANATGRPLAGATLDIWQAAPNGMYDLQDNAQPEMNMRGRLRSNTAGRYEFRSLKPKSYPVPHDGPVGRLLDAQGRHPYRPAHIHFMIRANGYAPLTTAVYIAGDPYIESDAVFGAKDALTVSYRPGERSERGSPEVIEFDFTLAPV